MTTSAGIGGELLEREAELARLRALIELAADGNGCVLLVEGEAGIGKTSLLGAARGLGEDAGLAVLSARGGELERDFAHGVARQLYEPPLRGAPPARRHRLLSGAAALAGPVLGFADPIAAGERLNADATFAANHGLYWLTAALADERPLLLLVDDAHCADSATLLFLHYLGRRIEDLPVLLALAMRPVEPGSPRELLAALRRLDRVDSLSPSALSDAAAGALVERLFAAPPQEAFRAACHETTGGNPFLLEELSRALAAEGVLPSDDAAERVRSLAPESIARSVLGRLDAMWPEGLALARAVAVLDTDAELRLAAALAGIDPSAAERAADALADARVLAPGRPLRFAHPIMRRAVYLDLPEGRRSADHARAARLLDAEGRDPDRAAAHLKVTEPAGERWVVERLRAAGERALARGAPEAAVTLLRRALAEPPPHAKAAAVMIALGRAELLAGEETAVARLREALASAQDASLRAEAAREFARALTEEGRPDEAVQVLERAIGGTNDRETALYLEVNLLAFGQYSPALAVQVADRVEHTEGMLGNTPAERLALAATALHRTFGGLVSGEEVATLALRALGDGRLLGEATADHRAFDGPLLALLYSDHHDELRAVLAEATADARARGSARGLASTLGYRARLEYMHGNLIDAEQAARTALEAAALSRYALALPWAVSNLVLPLVERGGLDAAEEALAAHGFAAGPVPPTTTGQTVLGARSALRLAQGRIEEAARDAIGWLEEQRRRGGLTPVRPAIAVAVLVAAGEREAAEALANENLAVAERWNVPGHTGSCLLALGLAVRGAPGTEHLRRAVELLERSPRRLERAHALIELGAAFRRANRRSDAREPLREGMQLAHRCGAILLAERAREELRATGARPRKLVFTGVDSLTGQEHRVAKLAAAGLSNPEIAQTLFVTRKTIVTHLGHVYQKLDIHSRAELAHTLAASPAGAEDPTGQAGAEATRDATTPVTGRTGGVHYPRG
ncbi:MAG: LuxR C-terminal-related transcriptional regulator [Actinomycetota bacterium]|nr:LuxR C-terminal-related transcriptional regulator [Actinomycetota bacterium]